MNAIMNDHLKIGVDAINTAVQKAFARNGVRIDDITWNPVRGGLVNHRFSIHSIQLTIGEWQDSVYRIKATDIVDYSFGVKREAIVTGIEELVASYRQYLESRDIDEFAGPAFANSGFSTVSSGRSDPSGY